MVDLDLVKRFRARDESVIEEVQKTYGDYCFTVSRNILGNEQDAEECVNDTYIKLWNSIPPACPENLRAYIAKVVRSISINKLKARHAGKRNAPTVAFAELEETLFSHDEGIGEGVALADLQKAINAFLYTCGERDRALFIRRYFFCEETDYLAKKFGLTYDNASKILFRTREKLKDHLKKEGYYL